VTESRLPPYAAKAQDLHLMRCPACGCLLQEQEPHEAMTYRCPRCLAKVYMRQRQSLSRTWALLITSIILYIPANLYPIMYVGSLTADRSDTIFSGIIHLISLGHAGIALIVFLASIVVPLLKMLVLLLLLLSVQFQWPLNAREQTRLYQITDHIGRWSMLDLYVIGLMVALVNFGASASVTAGPAATPFMLVVLLSIFTVRTFDPRLIWDQYESRYDNRKNN